jgi:rhodanese-related sulfurtransferase
MAKTAHELVMEAKARIREVGPDEAQTLVARRVPVLDVREADEYAAGHLPGAFNIPRGLLEFKVATVAQLGDRAQPVLVYCKSSGRAALATVALHQMGWEAAVSLAGGYDLWAAESLPTERPQPLSFE